MCVQVLNSRGLQQVLLIRAYSSLLGGWTSPASANTIPDVLYTFKLLAAILHREPICWSALGMQPQEMLHVMQGLDKEVELTPVESAAAAVGADPLHELASLTVAPKRQMGMVRSNSIVF